MTTPCLKVEVKECGDHVTLHLEGRLAGPCVLALEQCWRETSAEHRGSKLVLDVHSLTFVDREGRTLLGAMFRSGVGFSGARLAIQDLLDEICESPESRRMTQIRS